MQQTNFNIPFTIDKIYENLTEAKTEANSDGIYLNRYILTADDKKVYRKIYTENGEQDYEYITCLKVKCPEVKFIGNTFSDDPFTFKGEVRPGEEDNEVYEIEIPGLWGFDAEIKYNQEGFDKYKNVELEDGEDYISITNTCKGLYKFEDNIYYVVDEFNEAEKDKYRFINVTEVTKDDPLGAITSYYYLDNNNYKPCENVLDPFKEYKRIFSIFVDTSKEVKAPDTKRVRVNLPSLGKSAQEAWNLLYGKDRHTGLGDKNVKDRNSDLSSLAGIYNNLHDLTGNEIIVPYNHEPSTEYLFNEADNYYYYKKEYDFDSIEEQDKITSIEDYNTKRFSEVFIIEGNKSNIYYQNGNGGYNNVSNSDEIFEDKVYYKIIFKKEKFSANASAIINIDNCFKIENNIMKPAEKGEIYNPRYSYYHIEMETPSILKNKYIFVPDEFFIKDNNGQYKTVKEFDPTETTYYIFDNNLGEENGTIEIDGITIPTNLNFKEIPSSEIIDPKKYYCFVHKSKVNDLKKKPLYTNSFNISNINNIYEDFYLKYIEDVIINNKKYNVDISDNIFIGIPKDYYDNNIVSFSFEKDYFALNSDGSYSKVEKPEYDVYYYIIETKEIINNNMVNTYEKNLYYIKEGDVFTLYTGEYNKNLTYYKPDQLYVTENYSMYKRKQLWDNTINLNQISNGNNLLSNIKLVPASKIPKKFTKVLLSEYGMHENTINGLILYLNQLIDFNNTGERNFTTIKGILNILKDEINRIGSYNIDTISNFNYKISKLEEKINDMFNRDDIASDLDIENAKNTINKRINKLLLGQEYGGSEDYQNYEFEEFLYPIGSDNNYSFFGNYVETANNIQQAFDNIYSIIGSDNSNSSGTTVMSKIKELEQKINALADTSEADKENQQEEKKENEKVYFEVCESSNQAFSSIKLVENNSKYNPYTNTVFISLKIALTTNKNADKILSNTNNGLPKGLVKLIQDSQKYNISSNEVALSATQTGTFSRNYNARIEKQLGNDFGVINLSTTHDLKSNTSYGLQIDGSYLLGASNDDSSGPSIIYTINGQTYSKKTIQYIYASSLEVPDDIYSGENNDTKKPFLGWYYDNEKITNSKGEFVRDTSIVDINGGFKALKFDITLEAKYGDAQTVSSFKDTCWKIKESDGIGTGKDPLSVPSFVSNKKTFVKIYFSYVNGKPYTVRYHDSKGKKTKVYEEGKLVGKKFTKIKFTGNSGYSKTKYEQISGFLKYESGIIKYK